MILVIPGPVCSWVNHTFMYFPRPEHIAHQLDSQIRVQIPAASASWSKGKLQHNITPIPPLCSGYDWDMYIYRFTNTTFHVINDPPTDPKHNERAIFGPWTGGGRDTTPKPTIDIQHFKKPDLSDHYLKSIFAPQKREQISEQPNFHVIFFWGDSKKEDSTTSMGEVGDCHCYFLQNLGLQASVLSFWVMINFLP